jgi:hypothetical protein
MPIDPKKNQLMQKTPKFRKMQNRERHKKMQKNSIDAHSIPKFRKI